MQSLTAVTIILVAIACWQLGVDGKSCSNVCPQVSRPVCATFYRHNGGGFISCTFDNLCKLNMRECMSDERWLNRPGRCDKDGAACDSMRAGRPGTGTGIQTTTTSKPKKTFAEKLGISNWFGKKN